MFHSIYKDFLRFLDALETEEVWEAYEKYYYHPHRAFLESYWTTFRWMDVRQIRDRVRRVRRGDYSTLLALLTEADLESMAEEALALCMRTFRAPQMPDIYFMVGFFSADGFVLELKERPVIGFGLERFRSWRPLPVLFAHEYGHYLRHLWRSDEPYLFDGGTVLPRLLLTEGLCTAFSEWVFPHYPLNEHLFYTEERLRWCDRNEQYLLDVLDAALRGERECTIFWSGDAALGLPPRVGAYLGYRFVKEYMAKHGDGAISALLELRDVTDMWDEQVTRGG